MVNQENPGASLIALPLLPGLLPSGGRCQGQFTACKSNLRNLGTAMEMYSADNAGPYPLRLEQLTPTYLKTIPTCAATGTVTYRCQTASNPDLYTLVCSGCSHQAAGIDACDFPQYTAVDGLRIGP